MLIMSMKLNRTWMRIAALVIVAIVVAAVVWNVAKPDNSSTTAAAVSSVKLKSNEDRVDFIRSFGWEVNEAAVEVMEVVIPEEFDEVYNIYAGLQAEQGLDLEKYAGKRAKRWSYTVLNYPGTDAEVRANLLLHGDKLIACDLSSTELGGFMQGIERVESNPAA